MHFYTWVLSEPGAEWDDHERQLKPFLESEEFPMGPDWYRVHDGLGS